MLASDIPVSHERTSIRDVFDSQMAHYLDAGKTSVRQRIALLRQLEKTLLAWRPRIREALYADIKKPANTVDMVDIYYVLREIRHIRRHLASWMHVHPVPTPLALFGSRSYVRYQSKGVCLIISPWNYPINLGLAPLVSALAAGCTVILKPSEYVPHTSALLKEMLASIYPEELAAVIEGDAEVSKQLLESPFHHIHFTGSPRVGKIVMEAAAKHLASVTLELGGKCPVIVDATADIRWTADSIVQTKFTNAGQSCVAPDYVLVHESRHDALVDALRHTLKAHFPDSTTYAHDYCALIHEGHHRTIQDLLVDAIAQGARIASEEVHLQDGAQFPPVILTHVPDTARMMREEIFGPILPVIPYRNIDEVISRINHLERPLALYIFGRSRAMKQLVTHTRAGGICIDHCAIHYFNPHLPFGGINHSGIGKSHGFDGFASFSNARSTYVQVWKRAPVNWLHAPFTRAKQWLVDVTLRWL